MSYHNQPRASNPSRVSHQSSGGPKVVRIADDGKVNDIDVGLAGKGKSMKRTYIIEDPLPPIHEPDAKAYREFIIELLMKRGNVLRSEAENYTDPSAMMTFIRAMTHDSVSPSARADNYEMLEHLGDATVNKATTWYLKNRFPEIIARGDPGVQIISKQKSLLTSKPFLARYSDMLGLSKFIRYRPLRYTYAKEDGKGGGLSTQEKTVMIDKSMKEDVFEAFYGCLEEVLDNKEGMVGVGYAIVFKILSSFYSEQDIPTAKNLLVDAKTQLKELFDKRKKYGDTLAWTMDSVTRTLSINIHFEVPPDGGSPYDVVVGPYSTNMSTDSGGDFETNKKIVEQVASRATLNYLQKRYPQGGFVRYSDNE